MPVRSLAGLENGGVRISPCIHTSGLSAKPRALLLSYGQICGARMQVSLAPGQQIDSFSDQRAALFPRDFDEHWRLEAGVASE